MVRCLRVAPLLIVAAAALAAAPAVAQTEQTRETWQRVSDLFAAAGVHAGAAIADIGSGDGFLTVRLSPAVATGKVYAVDIDPRILDGLRQRVSKAGLTNVEVIAGAADDPHLPSHGLDGAIILNAYHEMPSGVAVLRHVFDALKPGGRLVVCEPMPDKANQSRAAQMKDHVLDPALILEDLRTAGFQILERQDGFATNLGGTHFGLIVAKATKG